MIGRGTEKEKNAFEIKSRYPASAALEAFLQELRKRQKTNATAWPIVGRGTRFLHVYIRKVV